MDYRIGPTFIRVNEGRARFWAGWRIVAICLVLVLLLSACGNGEQPDATRTPLATAVLTRPVEAVEVEAVETAVSTQTAVTAIPTSVPATAEPTLTALPTPTNTPVPVPVNGLSVEAFIQLPENVRDKMIEVFQLGQEIGRKPGTFSILGDSTAMNPHMLARFGEDNLNLGQYDYLRPAIAHFTDSFGVYGVSSRNGLHSWSVFDPIWADKRWCFPNEAILECEFRLRNPSVLIIRLGSNDSGAPDGFRFNVRKAIEYSQENGVMPVIATKADRFEGPDNINNIILRELAEAYEVPLWDFDLIAETLPERGLDTDGVHMVEYLPNDYTQDAAFESGHAVQDLTGLMMLYRLWQDVIYPHNQVGPEVGSASTPFPVMVNGLPVQSIVILPESVRQAMSVVFYEGQARGRVPSHFSKIGDSLIATPNSMTRYDSLAYDLGDFGYLEPVVDYFSGSFERYGVGTKPGLRSWAVFDPIWADPEWCGTEESIIACEIRLYDPAVILVFIGTNDNSEAEIFDENMRHLVVYALENGVIPVLVTKADRYEGPGNRNNEMLRQIAADYDVPLLDFDLVADTLPNRGLGEDGVHLTSSLEGNYTMPQALETGYGTHNLVVLLGLYAVWQEVIKPALVVDSFARPISS